MRGLRKYLTPFAPDQSGAVSVLFELGGLIVVCDAGGCTGNICGFDEPRWQTTRAAVFSAGLRDMDAILGRDDKLVAELADAARKIPASFAAIIGTPVPAVIGTDYRALTRMSERKSGLTTIAVATTGTRLYDAGAEEAFLALFDRFATEAHERVPGRINVLGATPLDLSTTSADELRCALPGAICHGMGTSLLDVRAASSAERNLVVSPAGAKTARLLEQRFGTPFEFGYPLLPEVPDVAGKRILIVHQQVLAHSLRHKLLEAGAKHVSCATFFKQLPELTQAGDVALTEEDDLTRLITEGDFDLLIGDRVLWRTAPTYTGETFDLPHFAVSGRLWP